VNARLALWGWGLLFVAAPLFWFPSAFSTPSLLLVPAVLLGLTLRRVPWRTPLDWPILGLALMVLVSLYTTFSIAFSLPKISGVIWGIGLCYAGLAYAQSSPRALANSLGVYLGLGSLIAMFGLLGTRWVNKFEWLTQLSARLPARWVRLPGAENGLHPNEVAGVLLWVAPLALALSLTLWPQLARGLGWLRAGLLGGLLMVAALGTTAVLILTQSRSGLLGLGVALAVMLGLGGLRTRWRWLALGGLLTSGVSGLWLGRAFLGQFLIAADASAIGFDARLEIWSRAIYAIQDFGLLGMGLNTFRVLVHLLYPLSLIPPGKDFAHAHNLWLQTALDLGLPGLVAYLALWFGCIGLLWQTWWRSTEGWLRAVSLGLLSSLMGHFAYSWLDAVTLGARPGFMGWLLIALVVATWKVSRLPTRIQSGL